MTVYDTYLSLSAGIQLSPVIRQGNVHAARERPCDITREYDCIRYSALGRLFSRLPQSIPLSGDF